MPYGIDGIYAVPSADPWSPRVGFGPARIASTVAPLIGCAVGLNHGSGEVPGPRVRRGSYRERVGSANALVQRTTPTGGRRLVRFSIDIVAVRAAGVAPRRRFRGPAQTEAGHRKPVVAVPHGRGRFGKVSGLARNGFAVSPRATTSDTCQTRWLRRPGRSQPTQQSEKANKGQALGH